MAGWDTQLENLNQACRTQFGEPVVYRASDGREFTLQAIFDDRHLPVDAGEAGISTSAPRVNFAAADLAVDPAEDDGEFEIRGRRYRVTDVLPDAAGWLMITLHRLP